MEDVRRRYVLGLGMIFLTVICWVGGDDITQIIFHKTNFNKPFFLVYFKSTMFMVYLLKLLKFVPEYLQKCFAPMRNPDELLGPSSYERLEYDRSDSGSDMISSDDDILEAIEQSQTSLKIRNIGNGSPRPKKGVLKKGSSAEFSQENETAFLAVPGSSVNGTLSPDSTGFETSTSKKIKFRSIAEVRCLTSHDITLQREARRPFNARSEVTKLTFKQHVNVAIVYSILWFIGNYLNALALDKAELSYVEILSASSSVFVMFLSAAFPVGHVDKLSVTKLVGVLISFGGAVILLVQKGKEVPEGDTHPVDNIYGCMFAIGSAVMYSIYIVYFRKVAGNPNGDDDRVDIVLFFGTVGVISSIVLLPMFPILHYADIERFEWPKTSQQWKYLVVTAVVGTVLSDLLWLWSTLLTSSLIATLGLALTTPVSILIDILMNKHKFSALFFLGTMLMVISFVLLNILSLIPYRDPILDFFIKLRTNIKQWFSRRREPNSEISSLLENTDSVISEPIP